MNKLFLSLYFLSAFIFGQELICEQGEIDLGWGDCNNLLPNNDGCMSSGCYSIEETTELNYSYITLGNLHEQIYQLINLEYVHLSDCGIVGELSSDIINLSKLITLQIYDNDHSLPDSFGINSNLSGHLPLELGSLDSLQYLRLDNNQISGSIPQEFGNMENLRQLSLIGNQLTGELPISLMSLSNLVSLSLSNNLLSGEIPIEIENLNKLRFLSFSNNQFIGEIPTEIEDMDSLYYMDLSLNNISGQIPVNIGNTSLWFLALHNNQLSGEIPISLGNMSDLVYLYLHDNQLSGTIPHEMGNLGLNYLTLNNNQFSGPISNQFCDIYSIDLSENQFCPPYPNCFIDTEIGTQDTSNCSLLLQSEYIISSQYNLSSPYPNPFNPSTTIEFHIPNSDIVTIKVYDLLGNEIELLLNKYLINGSHSISWICNNLPNGIYFIIMNSGVFTDKKKVILLK